MPEVVIKVENLKKVFKVGLQEVEVLKGISFQIEATDFSIIFGASGSGKSTLLHTILGLENPTSGSVKMLNVDIYNKTDEDRRSQFRKKHIGMIYQQPNWVKSITVVENVALPLSLLGIKKNDAIIQADTALRRIGMEKWAHYTPTELSSGQQQKIALCRAIVSNPKIIVADEPTGNLDFKSGQDLMDLMVSLSKSGKTIVMVTHDLEYLKYANKAIQILDGQILKIYNANEIQELSLNNQTKRNVGVQGNL